MAVAYERPFHPVNFDSEAAGVFSLGDMIDQLRREEVYESANRDALTLIHDDGLTAVLTVAKEGAQCEDHSSPEPTIFIVLDGDLTIESAFDGAVIYLRQGSAGALAPDVRHKLTATTDCAYLMIMGRKNKAGNSARRTRPRTLHLRTS